MTNTRKRIIWPALLIVALALSAIAFAAADRIRRPKVTVAKPLTHQNPPKSANANRGIYVRRSLLPPKLAWNLNALGDRLEKPGKERVTIAGTLTRSSDSQGSEFQAVLEFPDQIRLTIQQGIQSRVITFDGAQLKAVGKPLESGEQNLVESLMYDTADHFFASQTQGCALRFLGARFRTDDGSSAKYSGPYYDIYQVSDRLATAEGKREQTKLYYFNSDTLLLERVSYRTNRNGLAVKIEDVMGGWQKEQGQQVARTIERFEKQFNAKVQQTYFSDNDELLAKLAAGATGYDIMVPTSNALEVLIKKGDLARLDPAKLLNLKNVKPEFLNTAFDPGNVYSVPYAYSTTVLGYNDQKLTGAGIDVRGTEVIFEAQIACKLKGRITGLDSPDEVFSAAFIYLGLGPNTPEWGRGPLGIHANSGGSPYASACICMYCRSGPT